MQRKFRWLGAQRIRLWGLRLASCRSVPDALGLPARVQAQHALRPGSPSWIWGGVRSKGPHGSSEWSIDEKSRLIVDIE
jgi:hypothetical protein